MERRSTTVRNADKAERIGARTGLDGRPSTWHQALPGAGNAATPRRNGPSSSEGTPTAPSAARPRLTGRTAEAATSQPIVITTKWSADSERSSQLWNRATRCSRRSANAGSPRDCRTRRPIDPSSKTPRMLIGSHYRPLPLGLAPRGQCRSPNPIAVPAPRTPTRSAARAWGGSGVVRSTTGASTGRATLPTVINSSAPGSRAPGRAAHGDRRAGAALAGDDRGPQMRPAVAAPTGRDAGTAALQQLVDRRSQRRGPAPGAAEGDPAAGVDQVGGGGQPAVGALHPARQVVDQHRPGELLLAPVGATLGQLLLVAVVGAVALAGVGLAHQHLHEPHPVALG